MKKINYNALKKILIALTLASGPGHVAFSQSGTSIVTQSQGMPSSQKTSDKSFIMKSYTGSMMEAELGKAAKIQSDNQRIKNYGEMMAHDHTLANDELKSIAENKNIQVPSRLDSAHQKEADLLKAKSGDDFNKSYINMMVDDHKNDIKDFEEASATATDPSVKSFALKHLPALKMHLDSAKAIQKSLK